MTGQLAPRVLVGPGVAVVLPAVAPELVADLAEAVRSDDPLAAVVGVVGANLRTLSSVAAVFAEADGQRLLVRGASVAVEAASGSPERHDGHGVSTWVERFVGGATDVHVELDGATPVDLTILAAGAPAAPARPRPARRRPLTAGDAAPAATAEDAQAAAGEPPSSEEAPSSSAETIDSADWPLRQVAAGDVEAEAGEAIEGGSEPPTEGFDFAHLLDETHYRDVEAAAVRDAADDDSPPPTHPDAAATTTPPPAPPPPPPPPPPAPPSRPGLIDRVPSHSPEPPSAPPPPPAQLLATDAPDTAEAAGDHDGHTVSLAELRRRTGDLPAKSATTVPQVRAVRCPNGHPNPPAASTCRRCAASIVDHQVELVNRPSMGRLRFDDGVVVEIDRPLLVGRNPRADRREVPDGYAVVAVSDPDKSLSRLHLEIRLEEWQVLVVDRQSSNGTVVELPGQGPVQIRPDEPCLIVPDSRVRLGDTASFVYEVGG